MSDQYSGNCPQCGGKHFDEIEKHPSAVSNKEGEYELNFHIKRKCRNCAYIIDGCEIQKRNLLYKTLISEPPYEVYDEQCEHIEGDIFFRLVRILCYLSDNQWDKVQELSAILQKDLKENNHRISQIVSLIKAAGCVLREDKKAANTILSDLSKRHKIVSKSQKFIYEILANLALDKTSEFNFKDWIDDSSYPFPVIPPPPESDNIISYYEENITELFAFEKVLSSVGSQLIYKMMSQNTDYSRWKTNELLALESVTDFYLSIILEMYKQHVEREIELLDCDNIENIYEKMQENQLRKIKKGEIAGNHKLLSYTIWYKILKDVQIRLAVDILFAQDKIKEALIYIDEQVKLYVRPIGGGLDNYLYELFELPMEILPFYFDNEEWLPAEDMHQAGWACYYSDVWGKYLWYLTIIRYCEQFLDTYRKRKDVVNLIKKYIIILTEYFENDSEVLNEVFNVRLPAIIHKIFEERGDWEKAYETLKRANIDKAQLDKELKKYKIDGKLFEELKYLDIQEQQQLHVYTLLIIKLETYIREYIRRKCQVKKINIEEFVHKNIPNIKSQIARMPQLFSHSENNILNLLTMPQLFVLLMKKEISGDNPRLKYERLITAKTVLSDIRNKVAHMKINTDDYIQARKYAPELIQILKNELLS